MLISINSLAQERIVVLHPVVGDTIELSEINKFMIFSNYNTSNLDYLLLLEKDSGFTAKGYEKDLISTEFKVSKNEFQEQHNNIEKLNNYFLTQESSGSADISRLTTNDSTTIKVIDLNIVTPEFIKNMKKEKRRNYWAEHRRESQKNRENGMIY